MRKKKSTKKRKRRRRQKRRRRRKRKRRKKLTIMLNGEDRLEGDLQREVVAEEARTTSSISGTTSQLPVSAPLSLTFS